MRAGTVNVLKQGRISRVCNKEGGCLSLAGVHKWAGDLRHEDWRGGGKRWFPCLTLRSDVGRDRPRRRGIRKQLTTHACYQFRESQGSLVTQQSPVSFQK